MGGFEREEEVEEKAMKGVECLGIILGYDVLW